jgi:hypothetical protein
LEMNPFLPVVDGHSPFQRLTATPFPTHPC